MLGPHPLTTTLLLALLAGAPLASGAAAEDPPVGAQVLEGAMVTYDPDTGTAIVAPCRECGRLILTVTDGTEVIRDGKRYPLTKDTEIRGLVDTMYDPSSKTVLWFRPLGARR